ncbi:hypothetical protein MPSEU_001088200 [Mayamaea pseudoterrestris]|nr:hypothetical protein MPSEU_001088200 [Mayamaea pseudoterrestris]
MRLAPRSRQARSKYKESEKAIYSETVAMTDVKIIRYQAQDANNADDEEEPAGTYIKATGMKPPAPKPGMLNQEMAEAAAKKFKEREKDIQKACAKVDARLDGGGEHDETTPATKQGCGCIIL